MSQGMVRKADAVDNPCHADHRGRDLSRYASWRESTVFFGGRLGAVRFFFLSLSLRALARRLRGMNASPLLRLIQGDAPMRFPLGSLAAITLLRAALLGGGGESRQSIRRRKDQPSPIEPKPTCEQDSPRLRYADDLWIVPPLGGEANRLYDAGPGRRDDHRLLARRQARGLQRGNTRPANEDVYVVPAAGRNARADLPTRDRPASPGRTPDGKATSSFARRVHSYDAFSRLFPQKGDSEGQLPRGRPLPRRSDRTRAGRNAPGLPGPSSTEPRA